MCDTWVALGDATASGNVIFAKNSDRPVFDSQPLMLYPRRDWSAGSQIQLEYVSLPQVSRTYATLGSSPYWCWGYEEGINEYGVAIGNEAIYSKASQKQIENRQANQSEALGLLGMDLIRLALERSQTARQAVELMGELIEDFGQYGSAVPTKSHIQGAYDNSFIVADSSEAWVVEAVGRRWAARQFTQGFTSISNQLTIRHQWDAGSADIEAYACQEGWWQGEEAFDFGRAYIDDTKPRQLSHIRMMRSRQLLAERSGDITPRAMMGIARDHYEGSFLGGPYFDAADPDFLSICMHVSPANFTWGNTASSCVAILPKSPDELPVFWWAAGPPCNACYIPFFAHGSSLPPLVSAAGRVGKHVAPPVEVPEDQYAAGSYWWLFRELMDCVKGDPIRSVPGWYPVRNKLVRERFNALEADFEMRLPGVIQRARTATDGSVDTAVLDGFVADCLEQVLSEVQDLLGIVFH